MAKQQLTIPDDVVELENIRARARTWERESAGRDEGERGNVSVPARDRSFLLRKLDEIQVEIRRVTDYATQLAAEKNALTLFADRIAPMKKPKPRAPRSERIARTVAKELGKKRGRK